MTQEKLLTLIEEAKRSGQTSLDLKFQRIKELPPEIGQLTNLTSLDLSCNKLTTLPDSIAQLTNLTSLALSYNRLTTLPDSIGKLTNLIRFYITYNQLTTLPDSIGELISLDTLYLDKNQLTSLPESIGNLTNLTNLILWSNKLTILPESIVQLINLEVLQLNINQLKALPENIGELQKLRELNVTKNQLVSLPQSLSNLSKLSMLTVSSNQLNLPPEIDRRRKPETILEFLRQRREEGDDYIYEAKLIIIGEGGAGKTSLANKLIDSNYILKLEGTDTPEKSTEGIDVLHLDFRHPSGKPFRINLWDFGGQEIYHATHQFFLTKRSLYLLVADNRQENTDFNYWLEVVELLTEASPILIVTNEKQERSCQINETQLRGRFLNLKDVFPTNLATNRGLAEILTAIQHHIGQLPHIGTPLPKTWVNVRKALETDTRNYISQDEFLKLCDTHGFKRREDKLQLSEYLHDLGVCLHFQDDKFPLLKHYVILKPEWGTTAVYKVLDTQKVQKNLGCFTHTDLTEIWADYQYADMRDELLQLMMKFKLCYEIPHRPLTYIAPQLLSPNQPNYTWDDTDNLILRYHYEFMPKGMLTRFIVEIHKLIDSELVWKDGVILKDNNSKAEIIEARYRKEINIRISGKIKKSLLENIRYEFKKIHASYNQPEDPPEKHRLKYQEFIPCNCPACKGSQEPHQYVLSKLYEYMENQRATVPCEKKPYREVVVRDLIDDSIGRENIVLRPNTDDYRGKEYEDILDLAKLMAGRPINNIAEANSMTDQSQKLQNFNGPMSGVIASDHAEVSNNQFNQINNANTAELLTLIATMRQTAANFPKEIQDDLIIDIDDIETEIKKPEADRNSTKLRKRLLALATTATLIATPIAGMTDFVNHAIDLSTKLGIELPLPRTH